MVVPVFTFKESIRVVPLLDIHLGAPTFQRKAFEQTIDYIKRSSRNSENVYWFIDGDCIENITQNCPAHPYDQVLTPTQQVEELIQYLTPIKHRGLFSITGNHTNRTKKQAYYDLMVGMSDRLGLKYLDTGGYVRFQVGKECYTIATQHGDCGGQNWELEIKRLRHNYPEAECYIMGHDHNLDIHYKPYSSINRFGDEEEKYIILARGGSYLGFAAYAQKKSYERKITGSLNFRFYDTKHLITGFKMQYINGERIKE